MAGSRSARSAGPAIVIVVVAAVGGAAALSIFQGRDDTSSSGSAATSTTMPAASSSTVEVTIANAGPGGRRSAAAAAAAYVVPSAFEKDPGWKVRVVDADGRLGAIDLTTGVTATDDGDATDVVAVVVGVGGDPFRITADADGSYGAVSTGTYFWTIDGRSVVRNVLRDAAGEALERVEPMSTAWQDHPTLIGASTVGRPIVTLPDGLAYEVGPTGALVRWAEGKVAAVDAGQYAETLCSPVGDCSLYLHGTLATLPVISGFDVIDVAFSATGRHAVITEGGPAAAEVRVIDLSTGAELFTDAGTTTDGRAAWSPDGRFCFVVLDELLHAVDTQSGSEVALGLSLPAGTRLVGVA